MRPSASSSQDAGITLSSFSKALTDPDTSLPEGLVGPNGKQAVKRFNVYRNNVTVGLVNAMADTFPAVKRLVGEQFFNAMAQIYVQAEPPSSPLLFQYGETFPDFLERFEPARKLVYLPDVARLERAWLDAYHAADALPLDPTRLAAIGPEDLAGVCFVAHPASRVLRSSFAAVTIFSANRSDKPMPEIDPSVAEDGLVTRAVDDVEVRNLPPGGAVFLAALIDGSPLGEAAGLAVAESNDFDLAAAIAAMLEAGAFTDLSQP